MTSWLASKEMRRAEEETLTPNANKATDGRRTTTSRRRPGRTSGRAALTRRRARARRSAAVAVVVLALGAGIVALRPGPEPPPAPHEIRGSAAWALEHYGNPDARAFRRRHIVEIDFLGRPMFVHEDAARHFLRLERIFEARAPEYATAVALGTPDDWSYINRDVRGGTSKSTHAFGLAIDVNALANPLGTTGDMPPEVVSQWEIEGGEWGGDWSRPDPMHFETHLTGEEIRERYRPDGSPKDWYLERLTGG